MPMPISNLLSGFFCSRRQAFIAVTSMGIVVASMEQSPLAIFTLPVVCICLVGAGMVMGCTTATAAGADISGL